LLCAYLGQASTASVHHILIRPIAPSEWLLLAPPDGSDPSSLLLLAALAVLPHQQGGRGHLLRLRPRLCCSDTAHRPSAAPP
jgi:hypothetical protein